MNQNVKYQIDQLSTKMRERLVFNYWILVAIVFFAETLVGCYLLVTDQASLPTVPYIGKFIVLPTVLNALIGVVISAENRSLIRESLKNHTILFGTVIFCTVISVVHSYFGWSLALFGMPMFISVMLGDNKLTRKVGLESTVFMFVSIFASAWYSSKVDLSDRLLQGIICLFFLGAVYIICLSLNEFIGERDSIITKYGEHEVEMSHALTLDAMTSLYNHAEFNRQIEKNRMICIRQKKYMTVVVTDIDHFKRVNDTYGHEYGDKVLLNVAGCLQHFCSDKGQVFRYGGEEFAVILPNMGANETKAIMEEMRDLLQNHQYDFMPEGERVTVSIGIYKYGGEDIDSTEIFNRADEAMYEAKNTGRNRCIIYQNKK